MESFNAVFEKCDNYWIGYVEELPGANTQGETLNETRENLKEAVSMIIQINREITQNQFQGKNVIRENLRIAI
jgi:predicted RNase H-like HicB family nuclease